MPNLKKIYVLPDSLERYKETYGSGVKNFVEWSTDTSELPPSGLQAECIYSHSVYLTWKPADSDIVEGYQVYRDGTEFEGWYIDGIPAEKEITVNSDMEFYAVFGKRLENRSESNCTERRYTAEILYRMWGETDQICKKIEGNHLCYSDQHRTESKTIYHKNKNKWSLQRRQSFFLEVQQQKDCNSLFQW